MLQWIHGLFFCGWPPVARLIDMNGNIVKEWLLKGRAQRAKLIENGNLLTVEFTGEIREYDWKGNLIWEYKPKPPGPAHHDFQRLENGNTLLIYREKVPEEYAKKSRDLIRRKTDVYSDAILEVTPSKKIVWEWHGYEHIDINWYKPLCVRDWMHTNSVRSLPENRHYDNGDDRFKPGNVIISPRSLDTIFIIDKETGDIVWEYHGDYRGGLQGQHEAYMIEKELPGAGNILVFDNGSSTAYGWKKILHSRSDLRHNVS